MGLTGIHILVQRVQATPAWHNVQQFLQLAQEWPEIVGVVVAQQSRPIALTEQGILRVAVSSGVWAQTLTFERPQILAKLLEHSQLPIQDIHFSSRDWYRPGLKSKRKTTSTSTSKTPQSSSPSLAISPTPGNPIGDPPQTAQEAFDHWQATLQMRSHHLKCCPRCQCPTPAPELAQYHLCQLCYARTKLVLSEKRVHENPEPIRIQGMPKPVKNH